METFSALLSLCEGPLTGGFPSQRAVTRSFDVFFDLRLNKRLANNRDAGDLRRHRTHYDVYVMKSIYRNTPKQYSCAYKEAAMTPLGHVFWYVNAYGDPCRLRRAIP